MATRSEVEKSRNVRDKNRTELKDLQASRAAELNQNATAYATANAATKTKYNSQIRAKLTSVATAETSFETIVKGLV